MTLNPNDTNISLSEFKSSKRFLIILNHLFPSFLSFTTFLFFILIVTTTSLEFVIYQVGLLGSKYIKVLLNNDSSAFTFLVLLSIILILINSLMRSLNSYIADTLGVIWRKNITLIIHDLYFSRKAFYYIQQQKLPFNETHHLIGNDNNNTTNNENDDPMISVESNSFKLFDNNQSEIDNPDQRIAQDIDSMSTSLSNILPLFIVSPFVIAYYTYDVRFLIFVFEINENVITFCG
jgi:ATP-binding cassette, subfamily D (ALD), member 4